MLKAKAYQSKLFSWLSPSKAAETSTEPATHSFPTIKACYPTGSRFICNPAPTDTDDDRIVLVDYFPDSTYMARQGWTSDGEDKYAHSHFRSYRNGEKNYILVIDRTVYVKYVAATLLAKELNLTTKQDRIDLFSNILDDSWGDYSGPLPNKGLL